MGFIRSAAAVYGGLLLALRQAFAHDVTTCPAPNTIMVGALQGGSGGRLTADPLIQDPETSTACLNGCTSNRIKSATLDNIQLVLPCSSASADDTFTIKTDVIIDASAKDSYDFGLYFKGPGKCYRYALQCGSETGGFDPDFQATKPNDNDGCADLPQDLSVFEGATLEVPCDASVFGDVVLPFCASWDNNQNGDCQSAADANPGTQAHCICSGGDLLPITVNEVCLSMYGMTQTCNSGTATITITSSSFVNEYNFEIREAGVEGQDPVTRGKATSGSFSGATGGTLTVDTTYELFVEGCGLVGASFVATCPPPVEPNPTPCTSNDDCEGVTTDDVLTEKCCKENAICIEEDDWTLTACGDPHMTGFLGQKFDFTGEDSGWYCLIKDENMQVSMRVTTPVPSLPEITYITGLSVLTKDIDGSEHDVVIQVKDPYSLDSSCPDVVAPCLADGALAVVLDGEETLLAPGTVSLGVAVAVSAVNLPGACRSFGFDKYWERKVLENIALGRRLLEVPSMAEWILQDPTVTNMEECAEYLARAEMMAGDVFAYQSEHALFQIVTPEATIRLTHGRLHQVAMRDPTDQYDLPEHLTWQMNFAVDHSEVGPTATGILGETFEPTPDSDGNPIMSGMAAIRGNQEDYRVKGPLDVEFAQDSRTP